MAAAFISLFEVGHVVKAILQWYVGSGIFLADQSNELQRSQLFPIPFRRSLLQCPLA